MRYLCLLIRVPQLSQKWESSVVYIKTLDSRLRENDGFTMSITLFHGPAGAGKTRFLLQHIAKNHFNQENSKPFNLIVPHHRCVDSIQKLFLNELSIPGLFTQDTILTFNQFLLKILKQYFPRIHMASGSISRNIIRRLMAENDYPFLKMSRNYPSIITEISNTLIKLKKNGLSPHKARALLHQHRSKELEDLLTLFEDYQSILENLHYFDEGDLLGLTLKRFKDGTVQPLSSALYFDRIFPLTLGQREMIKEISLRFSDTPITICYSFDYQERDDPHFYPAYSFLGELAQTNEYFHYTNINKKYEFHVYADPAREIQGVIKQIDKHLKTGIPFNQMGILIPNNEFYHQRLSETLKLKKYPHTPWYKQPLSKFPQVEASQLLAAFKKHTPLLLHDSLNSLTARDNFEKQWEFEKELIFKNIVDEQKINEWKLDELSKIRVGSTHSEDGIRIVTLDLAALEDFSHLFILGFTNTQYPSLNQDHPFYTTEMLLDPILKEILEGPTYKQDLERHLLLHAINRTENAVVLSYPKILWDGQEQLHSSLLETLTDKSPVKSTNSTCLHNKSVGLALAASRGSEAVPSWGTALADARNGSQSGCRLNYGLISKEHGIQNTFVEVQASSKKNDVQKTNTHYPQSQSNRFSLSEIETYLKCPYQYFARYRLKLGDAEKEETDIPYNTKGSFVHRILDNLFKNHLDLYKDALEYDLYLKKIDSALLALIQKEKQYDTILKQKPYTIQEMFCSRVHSVLSGFICAEIKLIREGLKTTFPHYFEWSFGKGKIQPLKIKMLKNDIFLSGRIDRIDLDTKNKTFSVIDYKTGEIESTLSIKKGLSPQIPLYVMAVNSILLKDYKPSAALLISLKELGKKSGLIFENSLDKELLGKNAYISFTEWEHLQQALTLTIGDIVEHIHAGDFMPKPQSDNLCLFCDYRNICHYE